MHKYVTECILGYRMQQEVIMKQLQEQIWTTKLLTIVFA